MIPIAETENALDDLLFHVRRSKRYHDKRREFFENFQNIKNIVSAILGLAAVVKILTKAGDVLLIISALIVGVLSVIDLVVKTNTKARDHSDLRRRFIELEEEIIEISNPTEDQIRAWGKKRLKIEANEPPILKVLDAICHNEQLMADDYDPKDFLNIKRHQRLLAQFVDIGAYNIKRKDAS